jgi:hypothetical protein
MFLLLFHACVTRLNIKMELACARGVFLSEGATTMRTYTLNVTDFSGFVQPAAEVNAEDGDVAKYSKVFAKQLGENQPEFLNRGLCVATCDETGTIQCVAPIDTIH